MWISRTLLDRFFLSAENYKAAAMKLELLAAENSRLKSQVDWMAAHVTMLEQERAILLDRLLGVQVPTREIVREEGPPPGEPRLTPEAVKNLVARFAPPPEGEKGVIFNINERRPSAEDPVDVAQKEAAAAMSIFEDMGDEKAAQTGAGWNEEGELAFSR